MVICIEVLSSTTDSNFYDPTQESGEMIWDGNIHDVGRGQPPSESGSPQSLGGSSSASWLPQMDSQDSPILSPWRPQEMENDYFADWPEFAYLQLANEDQECIYNDLQPFANESQEETDLNDRSNGIMGLEDVIGSEEVSFVEKDPQAQIAGQIAEEAPYSSLNTDTVRIHKMPSGHSPTLEQVAVSSKEKTLGGLSREDQPSRAVPAKRRRGKGKAVGVSQKPQASYAPRVSKRKREQREKSLRKQQKKAEKKDEKHNVPPGSFGVSPTNAYMHLPRRSKDEQQNRDEVTMRGRRCCFCSLWNLKCGVNEPCKGHQKYYKITETMWDWNRRPTNQINEIARRGCESGELELLQKLMSKASKLCLGCLDLFPEDVRCEYQFAQEDLDRHQCEIPSFECGLYNWRARGDTYSFEYVALATDFQSFYEKVRGTIRDIEIPIVKYAKWCMKRGDEPAALHALLIMGSTWEADLE